MKRYAWLFPVLGALLSGGCSGESGVYYDQRDGISWQRDQWNAAGQELLQRTDPQARSEVLSAIDAAFAAAGWPLKDGQRWTAEQNGKKVQAEYHLIEEGPFWEISREWHRTGAQEEELVKSLSIPLKGSLSITEEGRKMADISLDLQGTDADNNGILGLEDELTLNAEVLAADFSLILAPCRLTGGEASFICVFSAVSGQLVRYAVQTRGLRADSTEKTLEDPYWDESWRYEDVRLDADALEMEADYPGDIHIRGWVESRKLRDILARFNPSLTEEETGTLAVEASSCLHLGWYYENDLEKSRATMTVRPKHILNRYDDYWTWEYGVLCNDGLSCSVSEFFSGSRFQDFRSDFQDFSRHLQYLMPFLFP